MNLRHTIIIIFINFIPLFPSIQNKQRMILNSKRREILMFSVFTRGNHRSFHFFLISNRTDNLKYTDGEKKLLKNCYSYSNIKNSFTVYISYYVFNDHR